MTRWKRLLYYLLLNILVSACTTWVVLSLWQRVYPDVFGGSNPLSVNLAEVQQELAPQKSSTAAISAPATLPAALPATEIPVVAEKPDIHITNIFGAGDLTTERVRLVYSGQSGNLPLAGWQLKDQNNHSYTFPQLSLFPGGTIDIYTGPGVDQVKALYWGVEEPVWSSGETATLLDPKGKVIDTYLVP